MDDDTPVRVGLGGTYGNMGETVRAVAEDNDDAETGLYSFRNDVMHSRLEP